MTKKPYPSSTKKQPTSTDNIFWQMMFLDNINKAFFCRHWLEFIPSIMPRHFMINSCQDYFLNNVSQGFFADVSRAYFSTDIGKVFSWPILIGYVFNWHKARIFCCLISAKVLWFFAYTIQLYFSPCRPKWQYSSYGSLDDKWKAPLPAMEDKPKEDVSRVMGSPW